MNILSTLKAGAVAAALSIGALAAVPAQAAAPSFSFNMHFGSGFGGPGMYFNYGGKPKMMCLSDQQIYWQLSKAGWDHVRIVSSHNWEAIAVASWYHQWYQLLINRCTGHIDQQPVAFHGHDNDWQKAPLTDFGITLHF